MVYHNSLEVFEIGKLIEALELLIKSDSRDSDARHLLQVLEDAKENKDHAMRQIRFNILSFEKSDDKVIVTIRNGQVEIDVMPDDLNKEDYQVLATYTPTDNPLILNTGYRFVQSIRCPGCNKLITDNKVFCSQRCYNAWLFIYKGEN